MTKRQYPLYEGLFKAKRLIKNKIKEKEVNFVFIAGGSATGKTSKVANKIAKFYKDISVIISMDNYFRGAEYVNANDISFDQPEAINIDLLYMHLKQLEKGQDVLIPTYDFINSKPIPDSLLIESKKVIIVEGLFTLYEKFDDLSDLKLFVETSKRGRLIRRVLRDIKRTRQKVNEIVNIFETVVSPMHDLYIEPQKEISDFVILNEFDPYLELRGFDLDNFIKQHNIPYYN